ncbi:hypothetical protein Tco_0149045, partial [Tanacetum coccineum]
FWSTVKAKTVNGEVQLQALVDGKKIIITESTVRRDLQLEDAEGVDYLPSSTIFEHLTLTGKPKRKETQIPQSSSPTKHVADEAVNKELDNSLVRAATTASRLEAKQDSGNITKTRSKATLNEPSSPGTTSGGGPRCQETMGDTIAQTRVLDLEKTKTTQAEDIVSLKRRVKKLEQKNQSRTHGLKRLYKVGLTARVESFRDEEVLDDADMFNVNTFTGDEVLAEQKVATKDVNLTVDEVTLAQALAALKSVKPKVKANVVEEPSVLVSAASTKVSAATIPNKLLQFQLQGKEIVIWLGTTTTKQQFPHNYPQAKIRPRQRNYGFEPEKPLTDLVEGSSKRAGDELEQEVTKKKKVDDVQETAKRLAAIDAIPLVTKPPTIVD